MAMQEMVEDRYGAMPARPAGAVPRHGSRGTPDDSHVGSEVRGLRKTRRAGFGPGFRLTFRPNVIPRGKRDWAVMAGAVMAAAVMVAGAAYVGEKFLLRDERFTIPSSTAIQIEGNRHMTRAQLLSIFGEDVDRNIFTVSLPERRAELEQLPWVERATVMRLLPNQLRISILERTPVAFVRQGRHIGLVDGEGVLLDMGGEDGESTNAAAGGGHYSFPVVTGISREEPLSVRKARMAIYRQFAAELDSTHQETSRKLSEVDLSNPEDVKALIPEGGMDILVHFGDANFLERYRKFEEQLPGWRTQYPKLASADMRYEQQVVLEMQPGAAVPVEAAASDKKVIETLPKHVSAIHEAAGRVSKGVPHGLSRAVLHAMGQPHFPEQ